MAVIPKMTKNASVKVLSSGCPENRNDAARVEDCFRENGWTLARDISHADHILFFGCALTGTYERNSLATVERISALRKSSSELTVCSCLVSMNIDGLRAIHQGHVLRPRELERLNGMFKFETPLDEIHSNRVLPTRLFVNSAGFGWHRFKGIGVFKVLAENITEGFLYRFNPAISIINRNTFFIKVCTGCLGHCSYCSVRLTRGELKSRPAAKIISEFDRGLADNFTEFALLGTELGAYGKDDDMDLIMLLKQLIARDGDFHIKLNNIHPRYLLEMLPGFIEVFESGKVSCVCCATQSGSNRILNLMNRGYRVEDIRDVLSLVNDRFPAIDIRTQLMVGFPGETEEDFRDTMHLLDDIRFAFAQVYKFEPRPGTEAAQMANPIKAATVRRRLRRLWLKALKQGIRRMLWQGSGTR